MNAFEYALGLFSVLIGLALADIAMSLHKLLRHARTVRWDGRVLVTAALAVLAIIRMWFAFWTIRSIGIVLFFPFYLSLFVELMILFLLAASCLPDDPPPDCDLGAFYEGNQRKLWIVFALFQLSYFLHWLYFGGNAAPVRYFVPAVVPLVVSVALIVVRWKRVHLVVPAMLIAWELYSSWSLSLT
jgi:hypothetical protein